MTNSTEREEWYTPPLYIDAVRAVLGKIDLDPCSCAVANETVRAEEFITREQDALHISWPLVSTLYCNPPYSAGVVGKFVERILEHYDSGGFKSGIVLINNVSDTKYWQRLARASALYCMTDHRISFINQQGEQLKQNTRGQTLFLLTAANSTIQNQFIESFQRFGVIGRALK